MPDIVIRALHVLSHLTLKQAYEKFTIILLSFPDE